MILYFYMLIKVHHQLEAIQQMTVFAGGMLMLGLNILMFGTLFLLIRVIQRMNKFEKVRTHPHSDWWLRPIIASNSHPLIGGNCLTRNHSLNNAVLVYGKPTTAASSIHGPQWKQLLFSISSCNNANRIGQLKKAIGTYSTILI